MAAMRPQMAFASHSDNRNGKKRSLLTTANAVPGDAEGAGSGGPWHDVLIVRA